MNHCQREIAEGRPSMYFYPKTSSIDIVPCIFARLCEIKRPVSGGHEPRKRYRVVLGLPPIAGFMSVIKSYCISLSPWSSGKRTGKRTN